jgi:hypothetical protein
MATQRCEPGLFQYEFSGLPSCISAAQLACAASIGAPHTGATPALFQQCGAAIASRACDQPSTNAGASACSPHGGDIANGGTCGDSWQCASGRCTTGGGVVCGTCVAQVPEGGACTDIECADGLVCTAASQGSTTRVCSPPVSAGGPCFDSSVCPGNTACGATTGTCDPLPGAGEACDIKSTFCDLSQSLLLCAPYQGICAAPGSLVASGQPCGWLTTTAPYAQCDGYCALNPGSNAGTCLAFLAEGQTCTTVGDLCGPNLQCQGVCVPMGPTTCDATPPDAGSGVTQTQSWHARPAGI